MTTFVALGIIVGFVANAQDSVLPTNCSMGGQVGLTFPDGRFVAARNAKVYLFYYSGFNSPASDPTAGARSDNFSHDRTTHYAGGQFVFWNNKLLGADKKLKAILKDKQMPAIERAIAIARHSLQAEDQAIAYTLDWVNKNPKQSWEVVTVVPNEQGKWNAPVLRPGVYQVVIRGLVSQQDADWVGENALRWEEKHDYGVMQPRYLRPLEPREMKPQNSISQ
jgi:hypothetical protein